MSSEILNDDVNFAVYLPPGYKTSQRSYPVVYLLHGFSDDHTGWIQFGEMTRIVDKAILEGEIAPMIVVMPDGGKTWYINDFRRKVRYEDMFFQEFIPYIDKTFRTRSKKQFRGIAGLSMGGHGALLYSLKHPDMFAACAAFSPGIFTEKGITSLHEKKYQHWFNEIFKPHSEIDRLTEHWHNNSVISLVKKKDKENIEQVRFYIDCGDDDLFYEGNSMLHIVLSDTKVEHEYRVRDGSHSWEYWRNGLTDGLAFISGSFHR